MADRFYKVCTIIGLVLLARVASRPAEPPANTQRSAYQHRGYELVEVDLDAKQISEALKQRHEQGEFELATAPIIKPGDPQKVILIFEQRWQ